MNDEYKRVPTSAEVWAVIRARHPNLVPFGSYTAPEGDYFGGDSSHGRIFTSYGFEGHDYPVIEAETTWDIDQSEPSKRHNEQHEYWLCLPIKTD